MLAVVLAAALMAPHIVTIDPTTIHYVGCTITAASFVPRPKQQMTANLTFHCDKPYRVVIANGAEIIRTVETSDIPTRGERNTAFAVTTMESTAYHPEVLPLYERLK